MKMNRGLAVSSICLSLIFLFQNCVQSSAPALFSSDSTEKNGEPEGDSGIPYDGKIYALMGAVCSDATQIQARIVVKAGIASLVRQNCQDISPVVLNSSEFEIVGTNSDQLIYQSQTFIATAPDAVGAGYGVLPKLTNPVDPRSYGAVGDGVTDNTAAFTSALNSGDILIPSGSYVINGTILVPAGRQIQCASLTDVKIINPLTTTRSNNSTFRFWGQGGSISNCRMSGAEVFNSNGSSVFDVNSQNNYLVSVVDFWQSAGSVKVVNNIFENCHGNGCVMLYGGTTESSNNSIVYNTFRNCGFYGIILDGGKNNRVSYNHLTDCSLTVENNNLSQVNFNNILEFNYLTALHGTGRSIETGGNVPSLSGGVGNLAADYSTNLVRNNTVVGNGSRNSILILNSAPIPAQYIDNACLNGCQIQSTR